MANLTEEKNKIFNLFESTIDEEWLVGQKMSEFSEDGKAKKLIIEVVGVEMEINWLKKK